jgi:hypothetical protein
MQGIGSGQDRDCRSPATYRLAGTISEKVPPAPGPILGQNWCRHFPHAEGPSLSLTPVVALLIRGVDHALASQPAYFWIAAHQAMNGLRYLLQVVERSWDKRGKSGAQRGQSWEKPLPGGQLAALDCVLSQAA